MAKERLHAPHEEIRETHLDSLTDNNLAFEFHPLIETTKDKLRQATTFDTKTVIEPILNALQLPTAAFIQSKRDKPAVDLYRKSFVETIAKHDKIFDAKLTSSTNMFYKLIFEMLREIIKSAPPLKQEHLGPHVSTTRTFFSPKINNSTITKPEEKTSELEQQTLVKQDTEDSILTVPQVH